MRHITAKEQLEAEANECAEMADDCKDEGKWLEAETWQQMATSLYIELESMAKHDTRHRHLRAR